MTAVNKIYKYLSDGEIKVSSRVILIHITLKLMDTKDVYLPISLNELAANTNISLSTITRSISELEAKGYIEVIRDTEAARRGLPNKFKVLK